MSHLPSQPLPPLLPLWFPFFCRDHSILSPPRRAAAYTEGEQLPVPARLQGAPVSWLVQPQSRGPSHTHTPHSGMLTLTHTYSLPLLLTLPVHPPTDSEYLTMLPHERSRVLANGTSWLASTVPSSCSPHLSPCPLHGHHGGLHGVHGHQVTRPEERPRSLDTRWHAQRNDPGPWTPGNTPRGMTQVHGHQVTRPKEWPRSQPWSLHLLPGRRPGSWPLSLSAGGLGD